MMLSINNPYFTIPFATKSKSARYLIAGKDNATELADLTANYLILKGYDVNQIASYDPEKSITLCEIGVQSKHTITKIRFGIDVMLALDQDSLHYASLLSSTGTLITDDSVINDGPVRPDTESIIIPGLKLSENVRQKWPNELDSTKLSVTCLFGALMALENEYLEPKLLYQCLLRSGFDPVPPYAMTAYSAFDWIREHDLTGKSLVENGHWQISQAD